MSEELKPCPFCGKPGRLVKSGTRWLVACEYHSCADGPADLGESSAVESWNTRPIENALRAEVARLADGAAGLREKYALVNEQYESLIVAYHKLTEERRIMTAELAEARDGIADLWNLCEILPHNHDCDVSGTGYCDCNRGIFNSTIQNIMDANHMGEG